MDKIYFDHAATTPVAPEVLQEMRPFFDELYGNPSSIYSLAQDSARAVAEAREKVAGFIGADSEREIIFTGGGTEADNLALKGTVLALRDEGNHIITSAVEHHAVLHTCEFLEKHRGYDVTYLPVDEKGFVDPEDVRQAIRDDTILISIMMANNEIGTIQPIAKIGQIARDNDILMHTDAVQAAGKIPVAVNKLNVDLLSLSAHKFYGPKGVGALYVRRGVKLVPQQSGGAQERKRRAGTENVPAIVGMGKAVELAQNHLQAGDIHQVVQLRDKIISGIENTIDECRLNGPRGEKRLPGNVNFCFRYIEGESILLNLDMLGIAASSGSACTSGSLDPSHVLLALGMPHEIAHGSLRVSLGINNTEQEADYFLDKFPEIVQKLRDMSPLYEKK